MENSWKSAFKLTTPVFMGYFAAGVAYGILATNAGMPVWLILVMCFTVFSGTAQYAAIPFFVAGTELLSVFLSTFLMSLRFVFYSLNLRPDLPKGLSQRVFSLAYLTDENFALLSTLPQETRQAMIFKTGILGMLYWTFSALIGLMTGGFIAEIVPNLDFALPCLFVILGYEQYKNQKQCKPIGIAFICFLLASQITSQNILLAAILIAIVVVTLLPNRFLLPKSSLTKGKY
ncbi:branched-chain amino acid permease [Nicoletella semolina]|nr:branched-chain amino acid permease [Nicoletella semolina]